MFDGLITRLPAPPNRVKFCSEGIEEHLTEAAVMVAFAMYLLRTAPDLMHVVIHPDGEHGKRFPLRSWFERRGFALIEPMGTTSYGGRYRADTGQSVLINPKPERADVVADIAGRSILAECKGGIINTKHPGQLSRLRKGLCEAVGQCLASPVMDGVQQFAVAPRTLLTEQLARRMVQRVNEADIEIALVDGRGNVLPLTAKSPRE